MGYLNEFPHTESNKLNLDWLLEQYRTFNDRIAEILAHFDEVAEEMRQENAQYKADMQAAFNSFKDDVNGQVASINNAIEQVSNNVEQFVEEHMADWQLEAMTTPDNDIVIGEYDPEEVTDGGALDTMIINNKHYVLGGYKHIGVCEANDTLTFTMETGAIYEVMTYNWNYGIHKFLAYQGRGVTAISKPTTTSNVVGSVTGAGGHIGANATMTTLVDFQDATYNQHANATITVQSETQDIVISTVGTTTTTVLVDASYITASASGTTLTLTNTSNNTNHNSGVLVRRVG